MFSPIEGQLPPPPRQGPLGSSFGKHRHMLELFSILSLSSLPRWSRYVMPSSSALLSYPQINLLLTILNHSLFRSWLVFHVNFWQSSETLARLEVLLVNHANALPREQVKQGDTELTSHSHLVVIGTVSELLPGAILMQVGADFPFHLFLSVWECG